MSADGGAVGAQARPDDREKAPLLSVEEARSRIVGALDVLGNESVALADALGRVLAADIRARFSHPPAAVSSMDGYALRSQDAASLPLRLRRIGASRAGESFDGIVAPGTCVRIFTGATMPRGADLIALQEDASESDGHVTIDAVPAKGKFIRPAGFDFPAGAVCTTRGEVLTARRVGLLAMAGHNAVPVIRKPKVAVLATGDELVPPGETPGKDQIVGSNSVALSAAIAGWGGAPVDLGIVADRREAIAAALDRARSADLLVTTGGASVGEHDLVHAGLAERGFALDFWRIAMRPGKPLMFGQAAGLPVLSLPGNPVSALVCALLFLRPAMAAMLGLANTQPVFERAMLTGPLPANDRREDYLRARLEIAADGRACVETFPTQDSSMLMTLTHADVLVRRRPFAPPAQAGDLVEVIRFDRLDSML